MISMNTVSGIIFVIELWRCPYKLFPYQWLFDKGNVQGVLDVFNGKLFEGL